jgi:hypothetical protein
MCENISWSFKLLYILYLEYVTYNLQLYCLPILLNCADFLASQRKVKKWSHSLAIQLNKAIGTLRRAVLFDLIEKSTYKIDTNRTDIALQV